MCTKKQRGAVKPNNVVVNYQLGHRQGNSLISQIGQMANVFLTKKISNFEETLHGQYTTKIQVSYIYPDSKMINLSNCSPGCLL